MANKRHTFVLCDGNNRNSHGFRTNVDGIRLERFKSNPVMLYGHDSYSLDSVIGKWENIRIENGKLMADAVFDTEDEMGRRVAGKALEDMEKAGELSGYSVEIDPEQNVISTSTVEIIIKNVPMGVMRKVNVKIGFTTALN